MKKIIEILGIKGLFGKNWLPIWLVTIMRLSGYLLMFWDSFWGLMVSFLFDCLDALILYLFSIPYTKNYHNIDKRLDYLQYLLLLPIAYSTPVFIYVLLALAWRTIGEILVFKTEKRTYFILFPNFVEYIFLIYIVIEKFELSISFDNPVIWIALLIFKVVQEIIVHNTPFGKHYWSGITWLPKIKKE